MKPSSVSSPEKTTRLGNDEFDAVEVRIIVDLLKSGESNLGDHNDLRMKVDGSYKRVRNACFSRCKHSKSDLEVVELLQLKFALEHRDRDVGVELREPGQGDRIPPLPNVFRVNKVLRRKICDLCRLRIKDRD